MRSIRYHKYLPLAFIAFFVNGPAFFPTGLLVTSILSPLLYFWLLAKRRRFVLEMFLVAVFPFALANMIQGMKLRIFAPSFLLLLTVYVTTYAFAVAVQEMRNLHQLLRTLIWINLGLAIVGLGVRFTSVYSLMWSTPQDTTSKTIRFRGFSSEASLYSTLLLPLMLFSYWRFVRRRTRSNFFLLMATIIPLFMSLSYGVIGGIAIALTIVYLAGGKGLARYKWVGLTLLVLVAGYVALPKTNPIRKRAIDMLTGTDSSEYLRTTASYIAGYREAKSRDLWFGIGLGETKDVGLSYITWSRQSGSTHFPCVIAETLGELGIVGLAFRFFLEFYFFFRTKTYSDPYRLSLFIAIFMIQFGGSFKDNLAEYMVWILAFSRSAGVSSEPEPVLAKTETEPYLQTAPQLI
ncbi:MAG: hypothetical protein WA294_06305 [Acidobacteriaceae bacterium]